MKMSKFIIKLFSSFNKAIECMNEAEINDLLIVVSTETYTRLINHIGYPHTVPIQYKGNLVISCPLLEREKVIVTEDDYENRKKYLTEVTDNV